MLKILKYYRPFIWSIIFAIVLLFIQAMCDLNLPNYMGDIVNVGIQSNGIVNVAPKAISEKGFNLTTSFMNKTDKAFVSDNYIKINKGNNNYLKNYPLIAKENIYIMKSLNAETIAKMDDMFSLSIRTFLNIVSKVTEGSNKQTNTTETVNMQKVEIDLAKIYQMIPMIKNVPEKVVLDAREKAQKLPQSILSQIAIVFTKAFYEEIGINVEKIQTNYIILVGAKMLGITLIGAVATIIVGFLGSRMAAGVSKNLRKNIFVKVKAFASKEFDNFSTASLITRTTNDINQIQSVTVMGIRMLFYAPIIGIGGIIMILRENMNMAWILGLACAVIIALITFVFLTAFPKFKIIQKLIDKLNLVSRESLTGIMVTRAFSTQKYEEEKFDKANTDLTQVNLYVNRIMIFMFPAMMLIMNLISILIVWVGAHQIASSAMQVGDMMAFMQYAMQVIMAFLMVSMMFIILPRASVSADRISEVLKTDPSIKDPKEPKEFNKNKIGYVEFKNVDFRYDGAKENVLEQINFIAKPGETTAFIGSTGSGKSTLINLIPRLYDVTSGKILVSGVNVKDVALSELYTQIGYVPQKASLLSGTIKSNLKYGAPDATDEFVKECARVAQAEEFIETRKEKYDSEIAQGGKNISGGQKQRLSIARALIKNSPIYIFDDSFSALDLKTDSKLRKALKAHTKNSTILIVTQRVSTIMNAEQIIVLDEGKIVGKGTHKELLNSCNAYLEIASSQMSKEELENE